MMLKKKIKYLICDVDGVMTSGHYLYSKFGKSFKIFGPHDHDGIKILKNLIKIIFITADKNGFSISKRRIQKDMEQKIILVNEEERYSYLEKNFGLRNIIYMGDGFYDAPIIKDCYFGICPKNARIEAKRCADFITPSNSGEGAVLDACLKIKKLFFK
tara:strand:- start:879 stop:1352 length:474 start_codon:yes stop_codon:yes gene_type:complete